MRKQKLSLLLSVFSLHAFAADGDSISTFSQLDALRSQNAILEAQVKNNDLKNKLQGGSPVPALSGVPVLSNARSQASQRSQSASFDRSAKVELVSGIGTNFSAKVVMGDGSSSLAKVGSQLPGLGVVKSISANEVVTQMGKQTYSIPFAQENPNNFGSSGFNSSGVPGQTIVPSIIPMGSN